MKDYNNNNYNTNSNNKKETNNYYVKININNRIDEITVSPETSISELKQTILNKYLFNPLNYALYYKNTKLTLNDFRHVSSLFSDKNPFLFIINTKKILPELRQDTSIFINTKLNEKGLNEFISKFFEYKHLPYDANIKNFLNGKYKIQFKKPIMANEFLQYYKIKNDNKYKNKLPLIKNNYQSISSDNVLRTNDRDYLLNKVISNNSRTVSITEKSVSSGINIYHSSINNNNNKNKSIGRNKSYLNKNEYKGMFSFPFLNPDEKYYREKYLDKKNWIDKKGFLVSVGNYKMKNNFISNYVGATPSESPLCHHFREVNKKKWVNKKGFYL